MNLEARLPEIRAGISSTISPGRDGVPPVSGRKEEMMCPVRRAYASAS